VSFFAAALVKSQGALFPLSLKVMVFVRFLRRLADLLERLLNPGKFSD
jgi:hypothetical protein